MEMRVGIIADGFEVERMISLTELRRIPQLNKLIERKQEHLIFLEEKSTSIPSTLPDHDRVQTSPSGAGNRYIEAAIDLSAEISSLDAELKELISKAAEFIDTLPTETNRQRIAVHTLEYRYTDCLCWKDVADLVGYDVYYIQRLAKEATESLPE